MFRLLRAETLLLSFSWDCWFCLQFSFYWLCSVRIWVVGLNRMHSLANWWSPSVSLTTTPKAPTSPPVPSPTTSKAAPRIRLSVGTRIRSGCLPGEKIINGVVTSAHENDYSIQWDGFDGEIGYSDEDLIRNFESGEFKLIKVSVELLAPSLANVPTTASFLRRASCGSSNSHGLMAKNWWPATASSHYPRTGQLTGF